MTRSGGGGSSASFHKDVVLIPNPSIDKVPSRELKVSLHKKGCVISCLNFEPSWDEDRILSEIWRSFEVLNDYVNVE